MVDHDDRVGLTAADRGPVGGRHVDGDVPCVRQDSGVEASQARTSAALRPSAWPSRPARTDRVDDRASLGTEGVHHGRQDRRGSRAAWMTVEPASRIRRPAAARSRSVIRAPAGISATDSVNDFRAHFGSRHHHRSLCHKNVNPRSP